MMDNAESHALANRLHKQFRLLKKWADASDITCFRVYEKDIPEYPLIIDWYDQNLIVWFYSRKIDDTEESARKFRYHCIQEILAGLPVDAENVYFKNRERQKGNTQYTRLDHANTTQLVREQGIIFEVNLSDFLDTGLFLDHRNTRALVRSLAKDKRVLNLFAYTGSFSCYAIAGQAAKTATVDISKTYCDWIGRNFKHNQFSHLDNHLIIQEDCIQFLEAAIRAKAEYDLIICDPPTFSNSKAMKEASFAVDRDYPRLIQMCLQLLTPTGDLIFSTNAKGFQLDTDLFPTAQIMALTPKTIPRDFRNQKIHQCWRFRKCR